MKYSLLFISFIIFISCRCQSTKDSTWPVMNWDKKITYDTISGFSYQYWEQPHNIDSSKWNLISIKSNEYKYFRIFFYGIVENIHFDTVKGKVPDSILKKFDPWVLLGGIDYLVGHMVKQYRTTNYLLPDCKVSDTISTSIEIYSETQHTKEYYVGGDLFGERIRSEIIDTALTFYFKDKKDSIVMLKDNCHFFPKKPSICYTIDKNGSKTYYDWEICHNLTKLYFTPKKIKFKFVSPLTIKK